jgi:hypothetical protein
MFEHPPKEKQWVSWTIFSLWGIIIFVTIPFARSLQRSLTSLLGHQVYTMGVIAWVAAGLVLSVIYFYRKRTASYGNYLWLAGVAGTYVWCILKLNLVPVETIHFVQYGLLGIFAYRALSHTVRDASIYFAAAIICGIVGIADESVQWIVPMRFWGWNDIWLNSLSGLLVQIAIAMGIKPAIISNPPSPVNIRRLSRLSMAALVLLGANLLNTPERIVWYAERIPFLAFLEENESVMAEYGFLYDDPEVGIFRSRFSPERLRTIDISRGEEAARILDQYQERSAYKVFLKRYTPITNPFVHEARVRLFRRDLHVHISKELGRDSKEFPWHCTVAYRENQIMEKYFSNTLDHSSYGWSADTKASLRESIVQEHVYESQVSKNLFTRITEGQMIGFLVCIFTGLVILDSYAGRRQHGTNNE